MAVNDYKVPNLTTNLIYSTCSQSKTRSYVEGPNTNFRLWGVGKGVQNVLIKSSYFGHSPLLYCKGGGMGVGWWWVELLFSEKKHHWIHSITMVIYKGST